MTEKQLWQRFKRRPSAVAGLCFLGLLLFVALTADLWLPREWVIGQNSEERLLGPSAAHFFGTDETGRDLFWRVVYATRSSLLIGVLATLIGLLAGVPLGLLAGYFGGWAEQLIMRVTDVFSALPSMLTAMAVVAVLGASFVNLVLAVGIASVPLFVRVTRAAAMEKAQEGYVDAARTLGAGPGFILFRHILPGILPQILVHVTLRIGSAIIAAAGLSFLGLGIGAPDPEWGALLAAGRNFIRTDGHLCFFPGLAVTLTVLASCMVSDGLRDALDPHTYDT